MMAAKMASIYLFCQVFLELFAKLVSSILITVQ